MRNATNRPGRQAPVLHEMSNPGDAEPWSSLVTADRLDDLERRRTASSSSSSASTTDEEEEDVVGALNREWPSTDTSPGNRSERSRSAGSRKSDDTTMSIATSSRGGSSRSLCSSSTGASIDGTTGAGAGAGGGQCRDARGRSDPISVPDPGGVDWWQQRDGAADDCVGGDAPHLLLAKSGSLSSLSAMLDSSPGMSPSRRKGDINHGGGLSLSSFVRPAVSGIGGGLSGLVDIGIDEGLGDEMGYTFPPMMGEMEGLLGGGGSCEGGAMTHLRPTVGAAS